MRHRFFSKHNGSDTKILQSQRAPSACNQTMCEECMRDGTTFATWNVFTINWTTTLETLLAAVIWYINNSRYIANCQPKTEVTSRCNVASSDSFSFSYFMCAFRCIWVNVHSAAAADARMIMWCVDSTRHALPSHLFSLIFKIRSMLLDRVT